MAEKNIRGAGNSERGGWPQWVLGSRFCGKRELSGVGKLIILHGGVGSHVSSNRKKLFSKDAKKVTFKIPGEGPKVPKTGTVPRVCVRSVIPVGEKKLLP